MKKITIIIVAVIVVVGLFYLISNKNNPENKTDKIEMVDQPSSPQVPISSPVEVPAPKTDLSVPTVPKKSTPPPITASVPVTHNVIIQDFSFNKNLVTIKKGDTVVWMNKDSAPHTVTNSNGGPSSQTINTNGTYSFTFNNVGTFDYLCSFHPSMKGTVVVTQ